MGPVFRRHGEAWRVQVKAMPNARKDAVLGIADASDGGTAIKVALAAIPEGGRANRALIGLIAKELGVAKSAITVVMGATQRAKVVEIRGEPEAIEDRLQAWLSRIEGKET